MLGKRIFDMKPNILTRLGGFMGEKCYLYLRSLNNTDMKEKLKTIFIKMRTAIYQNPVEVILAAVFCCFGVLRYETNEGYLKALVTYFPVFFLLTYILNGVTCGKRWRWVYYVSFFFFVPLFWKESRVDWIFYWVTVVEVQLLYLISDWEKDNGAFFKRGLCYLRAVLSSGLLAGVAWILSFSIYLSIRYIFEVGENEESRVMAWTASFAFLGMMPLLFLTFNEKEEGEESADRLFDLLVNYVLSPALLIYAVILYLYFIKIALIGTLPKGAVAYIVVSFVSATFILKGCQPFLTRRHYDWFFRYASWIVLPALAMYWIGTYYRINQYGFTEPRVYLVVVGGILTGMACLFMSKHWGRYLYAALLAIGLLGVVTYIPGFTAVAIERRSQLKRDADFDKTKGGRGKEYDESLHISSVEPIDIAPYRTFQVLKSYHENKEGVSGTVWNDTLFLYEGEETLLFKEEITRLFHNQMRKAGLFLTGPVPDSAFSALLQVEMDSALLILDAWFVTRNSPDSVYKVSYTSPAYYLKK